MPTPAPGRAAFARAFLALLPLWAGAVPVGLAYGAVAHDAGLDHGRAQLMSVVVFSAAAQVAAVPLLRAGEPPLVLVATAMALNAQLLLLGLAVGRRLRLSWRQRLVAAWFLTDGAYAVTAAQGALRLPTLLGAGVSMFVAWNAGTLLGTATGRLLPDPRRLGLDLVVPLTFLAVLVPLLRGRASVLASLVAAATALILVRLGAGGLAVLGAGLAGSAAGAWVTRDGRPPAARSVAEPTASPSVGFPR